MSSAMPYIMTHPVVILVILVMVVRTSTQWQVPCQRRRNRKWHFFFKYWIVCAGSIVAIIWLQQDRPVVCYLPDSLML
jgi:hypothetical protein